MAGMDENLVAVIKYVLKVDKPLNLTAN
jgi:hypothetical protein